MALLIVNLFEYKSALEAQCIPGRTNQSRIRVRNKDRGEYEDGETTTGQPQAADTANTLKSLTKTFI